MNNADRIREMTNEQLAAFLLSVVTGDFEECSLWEMYGEDEVLYWLTETQSGEDDDAEDYS